MLFLCDCFRPIGSLDPTSDQIQSKLIPTPVYGVTGLPWILYRRMRTPEMN